MEERKQKEIEYYDRKAEILLKEQSEEKVFGDFEGFKPQDLSSFRFLYKLLKDHCKGKLVLDYGCGNGVHSAIPLEAGAQKVIAVDLSEKSLEIASNRLKKEASGGKIEFKKGDCENTEFPENHFDLIMDAGTFSSLDIKKAFPEIKRILKPGGILVGIETFGHNPLANLKRSFNKILGKRTSWAADHIFQRKDIEEFKKYFKETEVYFFHPISCLIFPFLSLPGAKPMLKILELFDKVLLILPFLKRYSFKVVFIFKGLKKNGKEAF